MAKLKNPFLSIDATGSIGKALAVSHWKGIKKGMKHFKPRNPRSSGQQTQRGYLRDAVSAWQQLSEADRQDYNDTVKALNLKMSGYNYFLSAYIYGQVPPEQPIMDQLISWWKLDEGAGTDAGDSIGVNDGVISNPNWVIGKAGFALKIADPDSTVNCGNHSSLELTGQFTIEFLIKLYQDVTTTGHVIRKYVWADLSGYVVDLYPTEILRLSLAQTIFGASSVLSLDTWYHVVILWNGSKIQYIFNTSLDYETDHTTPPVASNRNFVIGRHSTWNGERSQCIVDDVRIYKKALSQSEIEHNYNLYSW